MNKDYYIQLTNNIYKLTLLFPKKEPLRYKMREVADEILAKILLISGEDGLNSRNLVPEIKNNLRVIDSFFEIAKTQNWLSPDNIIEIQKEYSKIREEFERVSTIEKIEKVERVSPKPEAISPLFRIPSINERQKRILEILKERNQAQVWELKKVFPEVSKRTIRRDFKEMLEQGLIEKLGEKNKTFYILKGRTEIG